MNHIFLCDAGDVICLFYFPNQVKTSGLFIIKTIVYITCDEYKPINPNLYLILSKNQNIHSFSIKTVNSENANNSYIEF